MIDRTIIAQKTQSIQNESDLLNLMNEIKLAEMPKGHPFTKSQLHYYCHPGRKQGRYISFEIPKKNGDKRTIDAPVSTLKCMLHCINVILNSVYVPSSAAMGFVQGKSVVDNAKRHINKNYVYNIDLKDFFPSIHQSRIWKRLQLRPFNFSAEVSSIIAGLCCIQTEELNEKGMHVCVLPQGSPASPTLTNIVCDTLDQNLSKLAKKYHLTYSRYADDITFSSDYNAYNPDGEFCKELNSIITSRSQRFKINAEKTRLQKKGNRQEVTGLVVSSKVNTTRAYTRELRQLLYMWEKYGYSSTEVRFLKHYKPRKITRPIFTPPMDAVIYGKLQYLKMVKGEKDPVYLSLSKRFIQLNGFSLLNKSNTGLIYLQTDSLISFEKKIGTTIQIEYNDKLSKDKKTVIHLYHAFFRNDDNNEDVSLSKKIIPADFEKEKHRLMISRCRENERDFWLVHYPKQPKSLDETLNALVESDFNDLNILL